MNQFPLTYVNAINSVGNGLYIDTEQEAVVIKPKDEIDNLLDAHENQNKAEYLE
ncbi:hypothetical protein EfmAA290_14070 [Enterococcus faecium]|nr:hypothetical protein EfmAA290_14070 [Enterococcus faecium]